MKIISYSDVHLEFGSNWKPARNVEGDLMILAGDNHEYYTQKPMDYEEEAFKRLANT